MAPDQRPAEVDARTNPWREAYDIHGRVSPSPSRAVEYARKVVRESATSAPVILVVELERARGLRAAQRPPVGDVDGPKHVRAYATIELTRGGDDSGDGGEAEGVSIHSESFKKVSARRAREQQRAETASSKKRTPAPVFKTKFTFYASRVLDDDVLRIVVFGERETLALTTADAELGIVDVPTRALGTKTDADFDQGAFWVPLQYRERKAKDLGTFTFHAYFDHETKGTLRVKVVSAHGIKASDLNGLSDPYVKVKLRRGRDGTLDEIPMNGDVLVAATHLFAPKIIDSRRTKTIAKTLAPEWNEEFEFIRVNRSSDAYLVFELWDHDVVGNDDMLGQYAFYVKDLKAARAGDAYAAAREAAWRAQTKTLQPLGTCNVAAYYEDDERQHLCVKVSSAKHICAANVFGTASAFIVATCGDEYYQTAPAPNTLSPRWDHVMRFTTTTPPPSPEALEQGAPLSAGQKLKFELYHRADDGRALFIGQAQMSLHAIQTASAGGDKHSFWLPFVERNMVTNLGEIRMRAYFESHEPAERPYPQTDAKGRVLDKEEARKRQAYDAMAERIEREVKARALANARQSSTQDLKLHTTLAETIASKLRMFQWPEALVPSYAKAYAACANAPELLPPPPTGCKIPHEIARMFEAAAFSRVEKPHKKYKEKNQRAVVD